MASIYDDIPGGPALVAWFGAADLSFHDAEIVQLDLNRREASLLKVHWWRLKRETRNTRVLVPDDDVVVCFRLGRVLDLTLKNFSRQNVISELVLRRVPAQRDMNPFPGSGQELAFEIELGGCYGLYGTIVAHSLQIEFSSGKPSDTARG